MLTELRLQNFKAWRDTGPMRLAPLTVIFGTNSSGKSSLGHLLMALKQTAMLADHKRSLHLGDGNSLIDLGTYEDCVYGRDVTLPIKFELRWKLDRSLTVKNILNASQAYQGRELALHAEIEPNKTLQPETRRFDYSLCKGREETLRVSHGRDGGKAWLKCEPLKLIRAQGRGWPVEPPEKFYRFSDRTLSRYQNADFLAQFVLQTEQLLENFYHLGP